MKCKVKFKDSSNNLRNFPRLMISDNGMIVLFEEEEQGVVLVKSRVKVEFGVGEYCECFNMAFFQDFDGKVIVSND